MIILSSIKMLHALLFGLRGSDRTCLESGGPEVDQCDSRATFDVAAFDSLICSHHPGAPPPVVLVVTEKTLLLDDQLWNHRRGRDNK